MRHDRYILKDIPFAVNKNWNTHWSNLMNETDQSVLEFENWFLEEINENMIRSTFLISKPYNPEAGICSWNDLKF